MDEIKEFVDRIIADGIITHQEHEEFMELVHEDAEIDAEESEQISRIFRLIQQGKLRVVNDERGEIDRDAIEAAKAEAVASDLVAEQVAIAKETSEKAQIEGSEEKRKEITRVLRQVEKERIESQNTIAQFLTQGEKSEVDLPRSMKKRFLEN